MSIELVNRISIKKNKVYMSTHSNNDTSNYHSVEINFLTEELQKGQENLDKKIIDMCFDYILLKGNHKSILPYKNAIDICCNKKEFNNIRNELFKTENEYLNIIFNQNFKELQEENQNEIKTKFNNKISILKEQRNLYVLKQLAEERRKLESEVV